MSNCEIQQQQQDLNTFYANVNNVVQQSNANFNVGVRMARQNENADKKDTLGKCGQDSEGKYKSGSTKTAPMLLTKPTYVWKSILPQGQRSIIAIMAEATMAQVKESSNFWGALFKCSQNQLTEQVKMAPAIAKFQIAQANQTAAATRAQATSAFKEGTWLIASMATATVIGAVGGAAAGKEAEDEAYEAAQNQSMGTSSQGQLANGGQNGTLGSGVNNGQGALSATQRYNRLSSWGGRIMNYGTKMVSKAVFGAQVAGQFAQGMSQMTVQAKYLKIQAEHQGNAGKAGAAAAEIQTLAQASGTMSNQQFQLASQTEQNGISGFLQTLSQAANGLAQAIGGVLSVR